MNVSIDREMEIFDKSTCIIEKIFELSIVIFLTEQ